MRLTILGSNGTYPTAARPASGYLVNAADTHVMLDAGAGTFMALLDRLRPQELAAAVISHVHPDHCSDLLALHHALAHSGEPFQRLATYCPDGFAEAISALAPSIETSLELREVAGGAQVAVGELSLSFATMDHPPPTLGVRVSHGGRSLVYSGDSGPGGGLAELAQGADLLLVEATFQGAAEAKEVPHHLTASEAAHVAAGAGVGRMLLTHIHPRLDRSVSLAEAQAIFPDVGLAEPGMEVEI